MLRLSAFLASVVAPLALAQPEAPSFRVDVKLVNVVATVKDATGKPVGALEQENFSVWAAGAPQEIAVFERQTDRPLSVALLFDASLSVAKELKFEQEAARRFARNLLGRGSHAADRIAVYKFSSFVAEVQDFTRSLERLEKALYSIRPESGTSVYDALYLAAQKLEKREGRKVIIIITDGGDTTSGVQFAEALESAQLADAVVYSIIVVPITSDAGRNLGGENALKTLSASTGGIAFRQHSETDLDRAFREIEQDLRIQYLIGFYPRGIPAGTERFHRIELRVDRPGVRVLARSGYFAPPEAESSAGYQPAVTIQAPRAAEPRLPAAPAGSGKTKKSPRSIH